MVQSFESIDGVILLISGFSENNRNPLEWFVT